MESQRRDILKDIGKLAVTRTEAAKLLSISVDSLERLRARGLIRASVALGKPLFSIDELNRFLNDTMEVE